MRIVVGLGNPGKEHQKQRHNVGFMALDYFCQSNNWTNFHDESKYPAAIVEHKSEKEKIILVKPLNFMNDSGLVVQKIANFYKTKVDNILVLYDELALPFGTIRIREGGSSAGHNGVSSLIEHLGDRFIRVRIGIENSSTKKRDTKNFVLSRFETEEEAQLSHIFDYTNHVIHDFISGNTIEAHTEKALPNLIN